MKAAVPIAFLLGYLLGLLLGLGSGKESLRSEAVKSGHAEYYLDANNERHWRWKEVK